MKYIIVQTPATTYYVEGVGHHRTTGELGLLYHLWPRPEENALLSICNAKVFQVTGTGTPEQEARLLQEVARNFPGTEILLLDTVAIGTVPPGEYVQKIISKDGVLPA